MLGELEGATPPEPDGFFGAGTIEGLRGELSLLQRWVVWRRTAPVMRRLGYRR
jgi:hypothetical protein